MPGEQLDEILAYLERSIANLARDCLENPEMEHGGMRKFLTEQFDTRLENLLSAGGTSVHHLESGAKNMIIQRRHRIIERILCEDSDKRV